MEQVRGHTDGQLSPTQRPASAMLPVAALVLGSVSWLAAITEVVLLVAGPFTCGVTWYWLWESLWFVVPLHGLTLLSGFGTLLYNPPHAAAPAGATLALSASSMGLCPYALVVFVWGMIQLA